MNIENSVNISNKILFINAAYFIAHKYFTHTSQLPVQICTRKAKLMGITSTYFHWHKVMAYYSSFICNIFNASGYSVSKLSFHTHTHTHTHTHRKITYIFVSHFLWDITKCDDPHFNRMQYPKGCSVIQAMQRGRGCDFVHP
jgi:hypothetical protein